MLPPGDHEQACKVFCRILRRLEERDRKNGNNNHASLTKRATDSDSTNGRKTPARCVCATVPKSIDTGAEEEHVSGDAAG